MKEAHDKITIDVFDAPSQKAAAAVTVIDVAPTSLSKSPNVRSFGFGDAEQRLAVALGLNLAIPAEARIAQAVESTNQALRLVIQSGLQLLSVKAECAHGDFEKILSASGMPQQRANEAMTYARFAAGLPEVERNRVLSLSKIKVLELARADPEVLQDLLDGGDGIEGLGDLSVRGLRQKIRELESKNTDLAVQREQAQTALELAQDALSNLRDGRVKLGGTVPLVIQDFRLEAAALAKKGELSIDGLERLLQEYMSGDALTATAEYTIPLARALYAATAAVAFRATGLLTAMEKSFGVEQVSGGHTSLDYLSPPEVKHAAREFRELIAEHAHEKTLREYERELSKPKGSGRPKAKPKA